ncbi:MAG: CRISPR-associated endoribonuclease Cas6 [Acutalibacteraceae bacterium]
MEITLKMLPEKPLIIPFNYFYQLQSAVYSVLSEVSESDFWHNGGYGEITKYKGFCFSGLQGKYRVDRENKKLIFENEVILEVRSAVFDFIDAFQRAVEKRPFIKLFDTRLNIVFASLNNTHLHDGIVRFQAVTPVVVHETQENGHTLFFSPEEDGYFIRICRNIERKYSAVTNKAPDKVWIRIPGELQKVVTRYKNTWITGYQGVFEVKTSARMAEFIYNTGLGEKNSQGFGFVVLTK